MDRGKKQMRKEKSLEWSVKLLNRKEDAVFNATAFHCEL